MRQRAAFITIEGGEGVGKSTNARLLVSWLREREVPVLETREPGGTALGETLRGLLLHKDGAQAPVPMAELLLVFAARAQHLAQVIRPALARGEWVVCDRFTDASFAYQGAGRALGVEPIASLAHLVHPDLSPDLTLLLDAPLHIGRQRVAQRGESDRFERENNAFFARVQAEYQRLAAAEPARFLRIDASTDLPAVQRQLIGGLELWWERFHA
jgi:dTMP kinase